MRLRRLLPFVLCSLSTSLLAQSNPVSFAPAVVYSSSGRGTVSVAVADLNLDGKPDMVSLNTYTPDGATEGSVDVRLGNGDGSFQPMVSYDSGGWEAMSVTVADVNGDGKPDILVAHFYPKIDISDLSKVFIGVLIGNGDGTFQNVVTYPSGGQSRNLVAADLNGDGKLDLVVADNDSVGVLLNNGDGTFRSVQHYDSGVGKSWGSAMSVAVADSNQDGNADIMVASGMNGSVGVLLGNGDGTFQTAATYYSGGFFSHSIAVWDMNEDGKVDLVVGNEGQPFTSGSHASISVLLGNGDGTFQSGITCETCASYSFSIGDLNGDTKPDIAAASYGQGIGVFLGNGDGTFGAAFTYSGASASVTAADVNGDGKPDLLVSNSSMSSAELGSVGVLINLTPWPYKAVVQPPINSDGSSVFKSSRGVIPVKFTLTQNNAPTCTLPAANIMVTRTAGGTLGSVDENRYSMAADNGSNFRIDQTACQYVYNLSTAISVGTYEVDIKINGVVVGSAVFALK